MHPSSIAEKEKQFSTTLTASGTKYRDCGTTELPGGYSYRSIRPSALTYYYQTDTAKKSICLHFTVGYIMSDIAALTNPSSHVSVSYVVDRAGRIYELFPDKCWSYHLGSGAVGGNATMSKQSIGIEISNYGPLDMKNGKLVDAYGNTYCSETETDLYEAKDYRGKKYYAMMTDEQVGAVTSLLMHLCEKHSIPMVFTGTDSVFKSDQEAQGFNGIFLHTNVRKDKFDWPMGKSVSAIIDLCTRTEASTEEPIAEPEPESVDESTVMPAAEPEPVPEHVTDEPIAHEPDQVTEQNETARNTSGGSIFDRLKEFFKKLFGH